MGRLIKCQVIKCPSHVTRVHISGLEVRVVSVGNGLSAAIVNRGGKEKRKGSDRGDLSNRLGDELI